jgi:kinesin family protein 11
MAGVPRPPNGVPPRKQSMRPPMTRGTSKAQSFTPFLPTRSQAGPLSPTDSIASRGTSQTRSPTRANGGTKRKDREFDLDGGEETNIHVVVRCRGRNDREVKENSGVVVATEGARGKTVELSMGPSALNNKTYHFDKVFSPAADQAMIFDDVVTPILEEVKLL